MSIVLSFGSIILGLLSWWIPLKAMGLEGKEKKALKYSVMSFSACVLAITLQIFDLKNRIYLQDWSALLDTIGMLSWVVVVLAAVTIVLNVVALKVWESK